MKTLVNVIFGLLAVIVFEQQSNAQKTNPVFTWNTSGESLFSYESIDDYLNARVVYPDEPAKCCIQGTEVVKFTITSHGKVTGINVVHSVCSKMDEEVIRVLKTTNGKWHPASIDGNPVDMEQEVSVVFKLHETTDFVKLANAYLKKGNKWLFIKNRSDKALKFFDCGINLMPNDETLLAVRGLCRFENGDNEGAIADWTRLKEITQENDSSNETFARDFGNMNGFQEMLITLQK